MNKKLTHFEPDKAIVKEVIFTTLKRIGNGKDDPIRITTQIWTLDGELIVEIDDLP